MNFLTDTNAILQQIQDLTGQPVQVVEDANLPVLARITRARDGVAFHLLRVNPSLGAPDYLVAYECAFILRQYQVPPEQRYDFASAPEGVAEGTRLVSQAGQLAHLPESVKTSFAQQLIDGLLTQLRSYPIGMRIDRWIHETMPELRSLQAEAIRRQQEENLQVLSPDVRGMAPKKIYDANVSMNAAFALFSDYEFGKAGRSIPYRSAGFEKRGRALVSLLQTIPAEPASDRALVDAWARELELDGWYQWIPAAS